MNVGDKVMVTGRNGRKTEVGEVIKVGRKLVTIQTGLDGRWPYEEAFRIETRATNDSYGHSRFWTMEEWDDRERRTAVTDTLVKAGLIRDRWVSPSKSLPLEVLEQVADLVRPFTEGA